MDPMEGAGTVERMLLAKATAGRIPVNGSLELLPLCNMNCDMCYVRLSREEMERQGRMLTAEEWLDLGRQMQRAGTLFLLLTGGEPLLYPEFRRVYLGLQELGMVLTINTNGTLIDEEWADFLGTHRPRRINITLYGGSREAYGSLCHYPEGFERVTRAVRLLRERGVDVKLGGSLTRANQGELEQIPLVAQQLEVPQRVDTYMLPAAREREQPFAEQSRLDPVSAARAGLQAMKLAGCKTTIEEIGKDAAFVEQSFRYHPYMRRRLSLRRTANLIAE